MSPEECRARAAQCMEMAEWAAEETSEELLTLATLWLQVASKIERAGRLFAEDRAA